MKSLLGRGVFICTLLGLFGLLVAAQDRGGRGSLRCNDNWYGDRLVGHCEIREQTLSPNGGPVSVDGRQNGGISVKGWDQNQILLRARVQAGATSAGEAEALAKQVRIATTGGSISASGPEIQKEARWEVSFELFVPRRSDVKLETHNGGIVIAEVNGRIEFTALNGGVVLRKVGGNVHGATTNGGLVIELGGDRWDGETLDVRTTNGGIVMSMPENYSAHLETGTVNGGISVDFPVTVQGRINKELSINLGSGGATVRAMTTNGGVRIRRTGTDE
ncbi:MAG: DUF4097 domain-containing protein [Pyrinomonadaceae bacterium]